MSDTKTEKWQDLWLKNYRGEGDTEELKKFVNELDFGAKKGASYLPWAVVERIFKFQGGKIELLYQNAEKTTVVEKDTVHVRNEIDADGVINEIYTNSYFINIKATWNGQEHIERYPLQDSSGKALQGYWTQNDLNKSMQRGKVKAIAIVSGIGYKLYEDGDLQFDSDDKKEDKKEDTKKKAKSLQKKKETKSSDTKAKKEQPKPKKEEPKPKKEEPKKEPEQESEKEPSTAEGTNKDTIVIDGVEYELKDVKIPDDRVEIENTIKQTFLTGGEEKANRIKGFLKKAGTKKIQELSDDDVKTLYRLIA